MYPVEGGAESNFFDEFDQQNDSGFSKHRQKGDHLPVNYACWSLLERDLLCKIDAFAISMYKATRYTIVFGGVFAISIIASEGLHPRLQ